MVEARGSATALSVAGMRAMESEKPGGDRLFYDPYARRFAGEAGMRFAAKACEIIPEIQRRVALRTRFIDDYVLSCFREGVVQMVLFGAGYDSRAYRLEGPHGKVRSFEIDHPATASIKRARVQEVFGELPGHVSFISIDFLQENYGDLEARLRAAGYDPALRTLFVLEGLISYLDEESVHQLLRFVASFSGAGSRVVLNYTDLEQSGQKFSRLMEQNARGGESLTLSVNPAKMEQMLSRWGFHGIGTRSLADLELRFYGENRMEEQAHYFTTATVAPGRHTAEQ